MHIGFAMLVIIFLAAVAVGARLRADDKGKRKLALLGIVILPLVIAAEVVIFARLGMTVFGIVLLDVLVGLVGAGVGMSIPYIIRLYRQESTVGTDRNGSPAMAQDREMVLDMLRTGKVSGEQAADLLKALGTKAGSADRLPLTISVIGSVVGAILVVIGFMLPWYYVHKGYQAGYHVGYVGWIVLIAGILPALFVCIPSLDKHVRQGLLRMVIACIGGAFVIVMLLRSPQGIGLWVATVGFALQLFTAFRQAGFTGAFGETR